jgi:hypothetical protein
MNGGQCHEKSVKKTGGCKTRKPDDAKAISVDFATQERRSDMATSQGGYLPPLG